MMIFRIEKTSDFQVPAVYFSRVYQGIMLSGDESISHQSRNIIDSKVLAGGGICYHP